MSTPSSTRTHVCFHTDIATTPSSLRKKPTLFSETSLTTPIKLTCRKSFGTNVETECSTKVSINKNIIKRPSSYILDNLEHTREDAYGTLIIKGRKSHKVTFIDNISNQNIAEIIIIDSSPSKSAKDTCECKCSAGCIIF